jgi:hypothetical protein
MNTQEKTQYESSAGNTIDLYKTRKGFVTHNVRQNQVKYVLRGVEDTYMNLDLNDALKEIGWES